MRKDIIYNNSHLIVYVVNLCDYGDRGDYEVFCDHDLNVNLAEKTDGLINNGFSMEYEDSEVLIFKKEGTEFTFYADGRLIIEGLRPKDMEKALKIAAGIIGFYGAD